MDLTRTVDVYKADARLIASAPDLLEALQYARRMMKPDSDMEFVDAAIAKATGASK